MEEGKHKHKSIVRHVVLKKEGTTDKGFYAIFEITFDNGDKGDYFSKTNPQTAFKEGVELEYQIEKKVNGNYTNYLLSIPGQGGGGKKTFSPEASNRQCALNNAVSMFNNGKIEKDNLLKTADWFYTYLSGTMVRKEEPK